MKQNLLDYVPYIFLIIVLVVLVAITAGVFAHLRDPPSKETCGTVIPVAHRTHRTHRAPRQSACYGEWKPVLTGPWWRCECDK